MREKTSAAAASTAVGLNINKGKSKILRYNTACNNPITIDGEDLEDVKAFTYLGSITDEHGGSDAVVKARIGQAGAVYLQLKIIWNSKQLSTNTKVRISNTNVNTVLLHHPEDTSVYSQLFTRDTSDPLAILYQQQPTVGENKADFSGERNQEETLEVDRTYIEESTGLHHKTSPHMKSPRSKEERKNKEHITSINGDGHEKDEQELNGPRKEGPVQSGFENAGRRPMLHWE
ncbi:unnamed protein product [Schistosoma curassoni]|uniref:DUF6451 domain-containing protein n=1 Tax=Schistosoma curassoni TaxID=6186 RepID=A0A183KYW6_9TREM|nr:unnamed protein product [Schistosoma curassoni]